MQINFNQIYFFVHFLRKLGPDSRAVQGGSLRVEQFDYSPTFELVPRLCERESFTKYKNNRVYGLQSLSANSTKTKHTEQVIGRVSELICINMHWDSRKLNSE